MLSDEQRNQLREHTRAIVRALNTISGSEPESNGFQSAVTTIGRELRQIETLCTVSFFSAESGTVVDARTHDTPPEDAAAHDAMLAETAAPPAPRDAEFGGIDEFFKAVAEGVIAAQQDLDRRSEHYLRSRAKISPPAVFHIPKVTAEFSLAAEKIKGRGINFIVSAKSEQRDAMQQKVAFEIVSIPPPVDARSTDWQDVLRALTTIKDDPNADANDRQIAGQLLDNHTGLFQVDFPTHMLLLYSPKPDAGKKRQLLASAIDRHSGETKVLNASDEDRTRFRTMVERLADLVGAYSDKAGAVSGNG